jgi:hypothetical protein
MELLSNRLLTIRDHAAFDLRAAITRLWWRIVYLNSNLVNK